MVIRVSSLLVLLLSHEAVRGSCENVTGASPSHFKDNMTGSFGRITRGNYSMRRFMSSKIHPKNDSIGHSSHFGDHDSTNRLPICFSSTQSRHEELAGSWIQHSHTKGSTAAKPLYWDLSCFSEWSKYSCVHQGKL